MGNDSFDDSKKLAEIERLCLATKADMSEVRWVRILAGNILLIIDPNEDWEAVAYQGKQRVVP